MRIALAPQTCFLGPGVFYLGPCFALEMAKVALAQAHVRPHGPCARCVPSLQRMGDGLGGVEGAAQIAAVNGGNVFVCQRLRSALGLPAAGVIEVDVELPLNAGVDIPSGFAVANGQYPCDFHGFTV